jgi:hypothetical protein
MSDIKACEHAASRFNPDSPSRRELRRLLRYYELDVAAALIMLDRIAGLDPSAGLMDITSMVNEARTAVAPFYVAGP